MILNIMLIKVKHVFDEIKSASLNFNANDIFTLITGTKNPF